MELVVRSVVGQNQFDCFEFKHIKHNYGKSSTGGTFLLMEYWICWYNQIRGSFFCLAEGEDSFFCLAEGEDTLLLNECSHGP